MNVSAHLFDIARTTDTRVLLVYRNDVFADECLAAAEKEEICRAIEKRFAVLNSGAFRQPKPRCEKI
jgi:hypothetical protein